MSRELTKRFRCEQCGYFQMICAYLGSGECRKSRPQTDGWPAVRDTDWCGEFDPSSDEGLDEKED